MRDGPSEVKYEYILSLLNRCTKLTQLNLINTRHGFNSGLTYDEKEEFRNQFQQLVIYDNDLEFIPKNENPHIAQPSIEREKAMCQFWELKCKQLQIFCGIGARDSPWSWWL